jgi:hypothetical protein
MSNRLVLLFGGAAGERRLRAAGATGVHGAVSRQHLSDPAGRAVLWGILRHDDLHADARRRPMSTGLDLLFRGAAGERPMRAATAAATAAAAAWAGGRDGAGRACTARGRAAGRPDLSPLVPLGGGDVLQSERRGVHLLRKIVRRLSATRSIHRCILRRWCDFGLLL